MKEFNFSEVGKRMPYEVPEGFFNEARRKASEIAVEHRTGANVWVRRSMTTAAAIALVSASLFGVYASKNKLTIKFEQFISQAEDETLEDMAAGYAADYQDITEYYK